MTNNPISTGGTRRRKPIIFENLFEVKRNKIYFTKPKKTFKLVRVIPENNVEDGNIELIGIDLKDMKDSGTYPLGILFEIAGPQLTEDNEVVLEIIIGKIIKYFKGIYTYTLTPCSNKEFNLAINKKQSGIESLEEFGLYLLRLFKAECPYVEKVQLTLYTQLD